MELFVALRERNGAILIQPLVSLSSLLNGDDWNDRVILAISRGKTVKSPASEIVGELPLEPIVASASLLLSLLLILSMESKESWESIWKVEKLMFLFSDVSDNALSMLLSII